MRVIAIVNQKGGCGKTTTAVEPREAAWPRRQRTACLIVDLDPQAHSTLALGIDPDQLDENLYEVLADPGGAERLREVCIEHARGGIRVARVRRGR